MFKKVFKIQWVKTKFNWFKIHISSYKIHISYYLLVTIWLMSGVTGVSENQLQNRQFGGHIYPLFKRKLS